MIANVRIEYFDVLDNWFWEVIVNNHSVYSVEQTYENALDRVRDELENLLEGKVDQ